MHSDMWPKYSYKKGDKRTDEQAGGVAADSAATPRPVMTSQALWGCAAHEQPDPGTTAAHPSTTSGSRSRRAAETAGKLTNSSECK